MPRYSLKTLLLLATAACFVAAMARLMPLKGWAVVIFSGYLFVHAAAMCAWGLRLPAPAGPPELLVFQAALAIALIVGPLAPYHINGRVWYDLGLSPYNPPPYLTDDGPLYGIDYDPGNTRPFAWEQTLGGIWYVASWIGLLLTPLAVVVSVATAVELARWRGGEQAQCHARAKWWRIWAAACVPIAYTAVMAFHIGHWLAD